MSAIIAGGTTGALLEVDNTSKAARATLYDSAGNEVGSPPTGSYITQVDLRPGAISFGTSVALWTLRAGGAKSCQIRRIFLMGSANPTTSVASFWYYALCRFSGANPSGGGTLTLLKKKTSYAASNVTDARQIASGATSGLTTTSITFESPFAILTGPRHVGATTPLDLNFVTAGNERFNTFELAVNEGIAILLNTIASIAGDGLTGHIEWDER